MSQSRPYLFRCPSCRVKNKIPVDKVGVPAKCGKCGSSMETKTLLLPQPVIVSDANFNDMVLGASVPVLVDCWATWCHACSSLSPIV